MRYLGGKVKIAKHINKYLNNITLDKNFYDLFCGSCNIIRGIIAKKRYANDSHKYLIDMWKGLQLGYKLPDTISELEYNNIKANLDQDSILSGFVGFGLSYSGKWLGGYCRDSTDRNYCLNAKNSCTAKLKDLTDVLFTNQDYSEVEIKDNSVVYCDIPYFNTTGYKGTKFNHQEFYAWAENLTATRNDVMIFVSEYEENAKYEVVLSIDSKKDINLKSTKEVLMKIGGI